MNRWTLRRHDERGTASTFVVGMAVTLLAVAGLVADGGNALNARMRLADNTEQAARLGAQQIDEQVLRSSGLVTLNRTEAQNAAGLFIGRFGHQSSNVSVTTDTVTVSAVDSVDTILLSLVGVGSFTVRAQATAEAVTQ